MGKHSEWRKVAKKARRQRIRQSLAKARDDEEEKERKLLQQSPTYIEVIRRQEEAEAFQQEEEARLRAEAEARWIAVEEEAQRQWGVLQKKIAEAREERQKQTALIRVEWEAEQKRLKELKEQKERELEEKEREQKMRQEEIEDFVTKGGRTPESLKGNVESNPGKLVCPFFSKTATCRFREQCSRNHVKPMASRILLVPGFYSHYSLEQTETEHGDSSLEFDIKETYEHFREFFFDVLPEMERCGRVTQFKVCCNKVPHLRGNVYVEYRTTREAVKGYQMFHGRWYGGRQLNVEFCTVNSWRSAICGLHCTHKCPKGSSCNYLHVFRNPNNLFYRADRDQHRTPPETSERAASSRREWRWSESPERLSLDNLSSSKRNGSRKRSRSRSRKRKKRSRSSSRERRKRKREHERSSSRSLRASKRSHS